MKNFIYNQLFNLYLFLTRFDKVETTKHREYDSLGIIDTLGYNSETGRFTASYSDELCCVWVIRIPFGWIRLIDSDGKSIEFCKSLY